MATITDFLASILNPNAGLPVNRMVNPGSFQQAPYLQQTGLGPEELARFHQASGFGGATAPQAAPPDAMAAQQAPQPAQQTAAPQGGFLSRLFGGGNSGENQTIQWLQGQGIDPGTATMMAKHKPSLQAYLLKRSQGVDPMEALQMEKAQLEIEKMRNPEQPTTDDIKEYQHAVKNNGYTGSLEQWMTTIKKAGATTVDARQMGTIPPGYRAEYDDQGQVTQLVPIPGGPVAAEAEAAQKAGETKEAQTARYGNVVIEDIDRAVSAIEKSPALTTGLIGQWMSGVAGTPAHRVGRLLETVKANAGFDRLQAMRDSSPTGGALGAINQTEMSLLQSAIGNLEQSQDNADLVYNLRRVQDIYNEIIHGPGNAPKPITRGEVKDFYDSETPSPERFGKGDRVVKKRLRFNPDTGALE